uniref:Uncharacterized protein n=1 Tax=Xiphophorus couchianus TaxID=32473 RepID=A0A3B5KLH4_9TELE
MEISSYPSRPEKQNTIPTKWAKQVPERRWFRGHFSGNCRKCLVNSQTGQRGQNQSVKYKILTEIHCGPSLLC